MAIKAIKQSGTISVRKQRRAHKHMPSVGDCERQLIAQDIHDGLAQHLAGAIMHLQVYAEDRLKNPDRATGVRGSSPRRSNRAVLD